MQINTGKRSPFLNLVDDIIKNGISASTYSKRADIIISLMNPNIIQLEYGNSLVSCETTMGIVINTMLFNNPSAIEIIECSSKSCNEKTQKNVMFFTYQVGKDGQLNNIQNFFDERTKIKYINCSQNCDNLKKIETNILKTHIFIDILYWEGKFIIVKNLIIIIIIIN